MANLPNPPFRDSQTLTNIQPVRESESINFTAYWQEWFTKNKNQIDENTENIASNEERITANEEAIADHEERITTLEEMWAVVFHVGILIETFNSANPSTYMGFGTWELSGTGRVTVCIDDEDEDFDTAEEEGGSKTDSVAAHTHTLSSHVHDMSDHTHTINHTHGGGTDIAAGEDLSASFSGNSGSASLGDSAGPDPDVTGSGGGGTVDTVPPYIVVYRWRRTA